jgi:hypothetical protein
MDPLLRRQNSRNWMTTWYIFAWNPQATATVSGPVWQEQVRQSQEADPELYREAVIKARAKLKGAVA